MSFFRSRQPSRKKVPKMTSQSPSGTLPGTRLEGKIGLLVALGAFQGRFWTPKGDPNGTQNRSKIDLGAQGPPKSAQEPPGGPKRPPREAQKDPPRRPEFEALRGPQAHEKAIRKYWSKGLSKPLYARSTNDPWLSGRYWGRSPTGDPATEPFRLNKGPWSEARERARKDKLSKTPNVYRR